ECPSSVRRPPGGAPEGGAGRGGDPGDGGGGACRGEEGGPGREAPEGEAHEAPLVRGVPLVPLLRRVPDPRWAGREDERRPRPEAPEGRRPVLARGRPRGPERRRDGRREGRGADPPGGVRARPDLLEGVALG